MGLAVVDDDDDHDRCHARALASCKVELLSQQQAMIAHAIDTWE